MILITAYSHCGRLIQDDRLEDQIALNLLADKYDRGDVVRVAAGVSQKKRPVVAQLAIPLPRKPDIIAVE